MVREWSLLTGYTGQEEKHLGLEKICHPLYNSMENIQFLFHGEKDCIYTRAKVSGLTLFFIPMRIKNNVNPDIFAQV